MIKKNYFFFNQLRQNNNNINNYYWIKSFTNKDVKSLYSVLEISNEILEGWTSIKNIKV